MRKSHKEYKSKNQMYLNNFKKGEIKHKDTHKEESKSNFNSFMMASKQKQVTNNQ